MISKHISDKEGVYSITATRKGLDNTPSQFELANMKLLAEKVFEPLREWVGGPIRMVVVIKQTLKCTSSLKTN